MKKLLLAILVLSTLVGCRNRYMNFNVPVAPIKAVNPEIKTVVLLDRTAATDKKGNLVEGILTGEGFDQDEKNKQRCLLGAEEQLRNSGRFNVIRATEILEGSKNGEVMSKPLSFEQVQKICEEYGADALVAMELYDSDFVITHGMKPTQGFAFYAEGIAKIDVGFRFYDGKYKDLLDEHTLTHSMRWNTGGNSIQDALASLLNKNEAVKRISYEGGRMYALRLTPSFVRVRSEYYRRGSDKVKYGARLIEVNDWEQAKKVLMEVVESPDQSRRNKGFAAHNLAVIYEINDDIAKAKEWAGRAWGEFRNKGSRDYRNILNRRY